LKVEILATHSFSSLAQFLKDKYSTFENVVTNWRKKKKAPRGKEIKGQLGPTCGSDQLGN